LSWLAAHLSAGEDQAESLSDALIAAGALSVTMTDQEAGTEAERAWYDEPDAPSSRPWPHNRLTALFDGSMDVAGAIGRAAAMSGLASAPDYHTEIVEEQDWVRLTQSQFEPICITDRLWIVPSWHTAPDAAAINLRLDPGLAFGTGSHPTTRLCLRWLAQSIRGGESVLDYGCGSGILAIAAKRLGAGRVDGVDIDANAVRAARDNARDNGAETWFGLPDALLPGAYDVVVANILSLPLIQLAPLLAARTRADGRLILAGLLDAQAGQVAEAYKPWFDIGLAARDDGWALLDGKKGKER
jgi:ribosomal protein L11 methyltransferase